MFGKHFSKPLKNTGQFLAGFRIGIQFLRIQIRIQDLENQYGSGSKAWFLRVKKKKLFIYFVQAFLQIWKKSNTFLS